MSASYVTTVIDVERCGADIVLVRLARPAEFVPLAGQWFRLTLSTAQGEETKTFTNAAAPSDERLEITTRLSGSAFKNRLEQLGRGEEVAIAGPGGRLTLPEDTQRVAYLVGGVGITPARSMLRDAIARGRTFEDALLVYGNRDATCIPYRDELLAMAPAGVRVVEVLERPGPEWDGERGFVTAQMVARHCDPDDGRPFYVSGPPPMVEAMQSVLDELEVGPERRHIEWFGTPTRAGLR